MATYRIENDDDLFPFDDAPPVEIHNEKEELASGIAPSGTVASNEQLTPPSPLMKGATLDEKLERLLSTDDNSEKEGINNTLTQGIEFELDAYVQAIRDYKKDEEEAAIEKKTKEASIKDALNEIAAKKKLASDKRHHLEHIIYDYLRSTGEEKLAGKIFNVSLKEVTAYSISAKLEEEIRSRANLPSWISMELKIDQKAFKELAQIPEGDVDARSSYKLQSWTEQEGDPDIPSFKVSLDAFLNGASIKEIASKRKLSWSTIKSHLMKAIDEGLLDIKQHVPESVLNELEALREHKEHWQIPDFRKAINNQISYDWTSLALSYLKIWSAD